MKLEVKHNLAALVDHKYDREQLLKAQDLHSFAPAVRFVEDFCETQEELLEIRSFNIASSKDQIAGTKTFADYFQNLQANANARYKASGNPWDTGLTQFDRRLNKLRAQEPLRLVALIRPYRNEMAALWSNEVASRGRMDFLDREDLEALSGVKLYQTIMESRAVPAGFFFDRKLSTRGTPVYSRQLRETLKLCFTPDSRLLNEPVGGIAVNKNTGESWQSGPSLELWMSLLDVSVKQPEKIVSFQIFNFFPVRENPLGVGWHKFFTPSQLTALVNIHLTMYQLLREKIDTALTS
jgi:hypothetical protein